MRCRNVACMHRGPMALTPLIIRWRADASSDRLRANARCVKCRTRGDILSTRRARDSDISLVPPPGQELCRHLQTTFLKQIETFPDGEVLSDHCSKFGFEGVVSKRKSSRYSSGPSRNWGKTKCPGWKRIDAERWRIFDGPEQAAPTTRDPLRCSIGGLAVAARRRLSAGGNLHGPSPAKIPPQRRTSRPD